MLSHAKEALEQLEGVNWAAVNGMAGRLIVQFDADQLDIGDLLDVVTTIEEAHGANDERFSHDRTEHPGDGESVRRSAIELAADVAGIGVSFTGMLLRATPLPIELAAIASWVEDQPRVRRELDNRLGPVVTDIGVSVTNVVGNALAQGPLGLVVDGARRTTALLAARARRDTWIEQEESLAGRPGTASAPTVAARRQAGSAAPRTRRGLHEPRPRSLHSPAVQSRWPSPGPRARRCGDDRGRVEADADSAVRSSSRIWRDCLPAEA